MIRLLQQRLDCACAVAGFGVLVLKLSEETQHVLLLVLVFVAYCLLLDFRRGKGGGEHRALAGAAARPEDGGAPWRHGCVSVVRVRTSQVQYKYSYL